MADVARIEHATLELARRIGLDVAQTSVLNLGEREGLLVKRFDRAFDAKAARIRRLRTEDLTQALGGRSWDKYDFQIAEVAQRLRNGGVADEALYQLIRQIVFNACIGNYDAHAKNYSLLIGAEGIRVAPLYDSICMARWPQFKYDVLAMPVNDVYDPRDVTIDDWRREAKRCGLDQDRVEEIVVGTLGALNALDFVTLPCGPSMGAEMHALMMECTRDLRGGTKGAALV